MDLKGGPKLQIRIAAILDVEPFHTFDPFKEQFKISKEAVIDKKYKGLGVKKDQGGEPTNE